MRARHQKKHESPNIREIEQFMEGMIAKAEKLRSAVAALPRVDKEGNSECPFAAELYAKKEKIQAEVEAGLQKLEEYLQQVEEEITRIKGDLTVVSAHQDQLHGDRAREHFSEAEVQLAALYKRYRKLRDRLQEVIEAVQKILQEAASKEWPGGKPHEDGPEDSAPPERSQGADQELRDLLEMDADR